MNIRKKKHANKLKREIQNYSLQYLNSLKENIKLMNELVNNKNDFLPDSIKGNINYSIISSYSIKYDNIMIAVLKSDEYNFSFSIVENDLFDVFDSMNIWGKQKAMFSLGGGGFTFVDNSFNTGTKPFSFRKLLGNNLFSGINFTTPLGEKISIEFCSIINRTDLSSINPSENVRNLIKAYYNHYEEHKKTYDRSSETTKDWKLRQRKKLDEFKALINSDKASNEQEIDKYLEINPELITNCFDLFNLKHQVLLKDELGKYGQDLKPDLLGYNKFEHNWIIVDYKRADKKLIKNAGKVRTSLKSEVNDLKGQLNDYKEYFDEHLHREYVKKEYKIDITHPNTIGIIGKVNSRERQELNRLLHNEPRWFRIYPYNFIIDKFEQYINDMPN